MNIPGIEIGAEFAELSSFGDEHVWQTLPPKKDFTNAFVFSSNKVLLGVKKRGFGEGLWNGFGGKVDPGETSLQAAKRELKEEACIDAPLTHCGILLFTTQGAPYAHFIQYYRADSYTGTPTETEEMRPAWFSTTADASKNPPEELSPEAKALLKNQLNSHSIEASDDALPAVPYDLMWLDDRYWFPVLIQGRKFIGRADFINDGKGECMQRCWFAATS